MTEYTIDLDATDLAYLRTMFPGDPQAASIAAKQQLTHPTIRPRDRIIAKAFAATVTTTPYDQDNIDNILERFRIEDPDERHSLAWFAWMAFWAFVGGVIWVGAWHAVIRIFEAINT